MANAYGLFWDSISGDRVYNAASFEEWLKKFFTTGVFNGDCQVTATTGMEVSVGTGYANVEGKVKFFDTATTLTIATANGTYPRIDTIVIERNDTNREITLKVVTGSYSGNNPTPTDPVRSGGIYQIVLAEVYVTAGATQITDANITDKRMDSDVCGWVSGTVTEIDYSQIVAQYNAFISEYEAEQTDAIDTYFANMKTAFDNWFDNIKDQLGTDAATELQNQIDQIKFWYVQEETLYVPLTAGSYADEVIYIG